MPVNVNEWCVLYGAVDKKTCNKLLRLGSKQWQTSEIDISNTPTKEDRTIGHKPIVDIDKEKRSSDVAFTTEQWVYDLIWPMMTTANEKSGWKYEIESAESNQITRYKKGGFYGFHRDGGGCHMSKHNSPGNEFIHGKVRKLSMTILLNDKFEGGNFEFTAYRKEECHITPVEMKQGDIIVFPSWAEHRVTPVTKGVRYSLVTWFLGQPFK